MTCLVEEVPDVGACKGILRSVLTTGWSTLWQTGQLDVNLDDDTDDIIQKFEVFVKSC